MSEIFIERDIKSKSECGFLREPTCHPAQTGPETVYGCSHKAWPQNRANDFLPIVECGGKKEDCEITLKMLKRAMVGVKSGITQRFNAFGRKHIAAYARLDTYYECERWLTKKRTALEDDDMTD